LGQKKENGKDAIGKNSRPVPTKGQTGGTSARGMGKKGRSTQWKTARLSSDDCKKKKERKQKESQETVLKSVLTVTGKKRRGNLVARWGALKKGGVMGGHDNTCDSVGDPARTSPKGEKTLFEWGEGDEFGKGSGASLPGLGNAHMKGH